eukprot:gene17191-22710_t
MTDTLEEDNQVISASSLLPDVFNSNDDDQYEDDDRSNIEEDDEDDLVYDVYNLTACDYHPIKLPDNLEEVELFIQELATDNCQRLIKKIFECPIEKTELGPLAVLPSESFILPREKRIPDPKPETKWEKYAKEKNIKNKKRDRMIFDELTQEWKPRFGYKRINGGLDDVPIVEVKPGQDPNADPWEIDRKSKKEKIQKNILSKEKNVLRNPSLIPGIPLDVDNSDKKRGKEGLKRTLQLVQHSTQSLGRFDDVREGEPTKKIKGKKRSFRDNLSPVDYDKNNMKAQLRIVEDKIEKKAKGVTNSTTAYEGILPDAPTDTFKKKKGKLNSKSIENSKKRPRKNK